ncbi:MAG: hypothetical protein ACHQ2Y_06065, partial [Candidatus Lutacidiplasmatales archaeon]
MASTQNTLGRFAGPAGALAPGFAGVLGGPRAAGVPVRVAGLIAVCPEGAALGAARAGAAAGWG